VADAAGDSLRTDEDDHDLLTFGEAGERLRQEIAQQQERVRSLEEAGASEAATARDRLDALRRAAERQTESRLTGEARTAFFGSED
jgi:hypothetical protein